ncbi:7312_t:CDS:2, partial [Gigaspora margarita]
MSQLKRCGWAAYGKVAIVKTPGGKQSVAAARIYAKGQGYEIISDIGSGLNCLFGINTLWSQKSSGYLKMFGSDICANDNKTRKLTEDLFQSSQ